MRTTLKTLINKIASDLFDAGVDIGIQLAKKDALVTAILHDETVCSPTEEEAEFNAFEGNTRLMWELKAKGGAIAAVFNQEVEIDGSES